MLLLLMLWRAGLLRMLLLLLLLGTLLLLKTLLMLLLLCRDELLSLLLWCRCGRRCRLLLLLLLLSGEVLEMRLSLRLCMRDGVTKMCVLRVDWIARRGVDIGDIGVLLMLLLLLAVRIRDGRSRGDRLLIRHQRTSPLHCLLLCRGSSSNSRCAIGIGSQHRAIARNGLLTLSRLCVRLSGSSDLGRVHALGLLCLC